MSRKKSKEGEEELKGLKEEQGVVVEARVAGREGLTAPSARAALGNAAPLRFFEFFEFFLSPPCFFS
ncbi:MAG TPA: hypothetical protein VGL66_15015 [Caulobacteraceae bacterium]